MNRRRRSVIHDVGGVLGEETVARLLSARRRYLAMVDDRAACRASVSMTGLFSTGGLERAMMPTLPRSLEPAHSPDDERLERRAGARARGR